MEGVWDHTISIFKVDRHAIQEIHRLLVQADPIQPKQANTFQVSPDNTTVLKSLVEVFTQGYKF